MRLFFLFDSTKSQEALILTQLMNYNGFQELIQIDPRLKMVFWNLIQIDSTQMAFQKFDSNLLMNQKAFQNLDSNQLMTQKAF